MFQHSKKIILLFLFASTLLFAESTAGQGMISILFGAFLAGVLLTFTPCVLPMIPILSTIIVGKGEDISKRKAVTLSLSYVMGTAVTYAVMGALAGATGEQLQSYFQNVWFIGFMSFVFVIMALSMFGLYNIEMPSFLQSRLNKSSNERKGDSLPMVFLLGMVSALILGACVSPVLISFLGVAISTGDATLGAVTMFFMALGMGVPLVLLGFGAGHILPKVGGWMDNIKYIFGVLLIGVAIYLFNSMNLFSPLLLWGVFFIILSIYLNATSTLNSEADGFQKFIKGVGTALLIWGTILLVGGAYGESNFLKPLPKTEISYIQKTINNKQIADNNDMPFENIGNLKELALKQKEAKDANKLVIIYFYTDWCPVCKHLKESTFPDPEVSEELTKDYIALKVNMTDKEDEAIQALKTKFNVFGPPNFIFLNKEGNELKDDNFYGYLEPEIFLDTIELIAE